MTKPAVGALLEKITRIIPGIAGYQDRENRRDADLAVRTKAATEVARCKRVLRSTPRDTPKPKPVVKAVEAAPEPSSTPAEPVTNGVADLAKQLELKWKG